MPYVDNPFTPDLGFRRAGCPCGQHESEFEHEKAVALEASRQARRRFIAQSFRNLFQRPEDHGDAIGNAVSVTVGRTYKA
jgi:hypothetical protein